MGRRRRTASNYERAQGEMARHAREKSAAKAATEKPTQAADAPVRPGPYERLLAKLDRDNGRQSNGGEGNHGR
jgi:hypothetical protein